MWQNTKFGPKMHSLIMNHIMIMRWIATISVYLLLPMPEKAWLCKANEMTRIWNSDLQLRWNIDALTSKAEPQSYTKRPQYGVLRLHCVKLHIFIFISAERYCHPDHLSGWPEANLLRNYSFIFILQSISTLKISGCRIHCNVTRGSVRMTLLASLSLFCTPTHPCSNLF